MKIEFTSELVTLLRDELIPVDQTADLHIMQGTVPATGELTGSLNVENRILPDSLLQFVDVSRATNADGVEWDYLEDDEIAVYKTNANVRAEKNGVATWMLYRWLSAAGTPVYWAGTITRPGLGGNLIIADTTIVSGKLYWLDPVTFKLPHSFE